MFLRLTTTNKNNIITSFTYFGVKLSCVCPQAQRQPGLRRQGPAHKRRRAAARTAAAAEHAAASENVAKEVTGSVTKQVAKALTKQVLA